MSSILELKESEVVKFIVEHFDYDFFKELGINTKVRIFSEKENIIENREIDLLIIDPDTPEEAIVFECKQIKVEIKEDQTEKVNKVENLKELVGQVNDRIKRGFHKVYLTVLIVCDGRNKIANNIFFNHASSETRESIYTHPYLDKLDPKAGILFLEPNQPTEKDYNLLAGCAISEMRKPTPLKQPKELTEKLKELLIVK